MHKIMRPAASVKLAVYQPVNLRAGRLRVHDISNIKSWSLFILTLLLGRWLAC